jgi:hypothetical protein
LLVRDAVTFPEVVAVARALVDPRMQQLAAGGGSGALVRRGDGGGRVAAALGAHLGRAWLGEVRAGERSGPLASWAQAVDRERRRPASFEPKIVKKRQKRLTRVDDMVISLAAKGLTTGEVQAQSIRRSSNCGRTRERGSSCSCGSTPRSAALSARRTQSSR